MNSSLHLRLALLLVFLPLIPAYPLWADVIYVDASATGANNGSSWPDAYNHLQDALWAAGSGSEIWVAQGTYKPDEDTAHPDGNDSRYATFQLKNGVAIYGGFPTGGGSRDPNIYVTSLSGDINVPDDNNDNSCHVVTSSDTDSTAVLDGFTITAGNANDVSPPYCYGGGMYNYSGSPTLTDCNFSGNYAYYGGGLLNDHGNPTMTCCLFNNNSTICDGGGVYNASGNPTLTYCSFNDNWADDYGGGMCNDSSSPTLTNCTFCGNKADVGGGIFSWYDSSPTLTNCTFNDNSAWDIGGGMYNDGGNSTVTNCTFTGNAADYGGGMHNYDSDPNIVNCTFTGNVASSYGGGMLNEDSSPTLTNCTFSDSWAAIGGGICNWYYSSSPVLTNCTFSGNSAGIFGGGMYNFYGSPALTNCIFSYNLAEYDGGGMYSDYYSSPTLNNCIFNNNSADYGGGIYNYYSDPNIVNCTFTGNDANETGGGICDQNSSPTLTNCTFSGNVTQGKGGGMYNSYSNSNITNCTFAGNDANYGGGMHNDYSDPNITNCIFSGNDANLGGGMFNYYRNDPNIVNCTFSGNNANYGGGMCNTGNSRPTLTNCTFSGNSAQPFGGGMYNIYSHPTLANCILWGNTPQQIYNGEDGFAIVNFSDVQGGWTGPGNINKNPLFIDADGPDNIFGTADDNLRLSFGSPCIDAGDNTTVPDGIETDLDGNPRFKDDTRTLDTGNGTPPIVDMGAYEYQLLIFVDANATGANNGSSWPDAYKYLQDALTAAGPNYTIWVAQGTYRPDANTSNPGGTGDREMTFQLKNAVAIYGGFPIGGGNWESRNPHTYETILSGDIGTAGVNTDNSYSVVTGSDTNSSAILDGFTITSGFCVGTENTGSGMHNSSGSPTLTNCTFSGNFASFGGGMGNSSSRPTLTNCTFAGNLATNYGGGMDNYNSSPTITNCTFIGNSAQSGGGMYNSNSSNPILANCILWDNTATTGLQIYGNASATYCDVQGGWTGTGNINANPLFVDADGPDDTIGTADDNLRLSFGSPCIDSGNNNAVPEGVVTDLEGRLRFFDDLLTLDTGSGTPPIVDMGPYEYQPIYVDAGAIGANNGSSWADAYKYLQDALMAALSGNSIWVAQSTYKPDANNVYPSGTNDRTATFQLKNNVALYGGFPSGGGSRDPNIYTTILSGDINVPDSNNDNSYHVVTGSGTDSNAILDGFTITKGKASGLYANGYGGGMYNEDCSPTLANCTFTGNSANTYGGGMYNEGSSPMVTNCTFTGNSTNDGGGMCNTSHSSPTVTNCTFSDNSAGYGGGIYNHYYSDPNINNCIFSNNSASNRGGGMYISSSSPILVNCVFTDNSADTKEGGGMCTSGSSSPTLTNCIFSGNSANSGGGMYNFNYSSPTLVNCTFNGNLAVNYGGGIYDSNGSPTLANCILWGNTATTGPQIHNVGSSHPVVSFSDVQGGYSGTSNINADPLFVNAGDNLRLSPGSPCIDTANNLAVPTGIETDLDGRDRFVDGDCNTTVIVDMGAFEFTSAYFGDFDSDCDVDFLDYAIQAQLWLTDEFLADIAPTPAGDGLVDTSDLAVLCDNWLYGVDE